jgi:hypothetical protein
MKVDKNTIPRRYRVDLFTPVEKMIYECQGEVEKMGADIRLTDALNLLIEARHKIAEFVDDMCDHPVNRLHGLNGVYYCDKCRTSFHFDNSDQPSEVSDEDIEAWARSQNTDELRKDGLIKGAKAMRYGQIPKKY